MLVQISTGRIHIQVCSSQIVDISHARDVKKTRKPNRGIGVVESKISGRKSTAAIVLLAIALAQALSV